MEHEVASAKRKCRDGTKWNRIASGKPDPSSTELNKLNSTKLNLTELN